MRITLWSIYLAVSRLGLEKEGVFSKMKRKRSRLSIHRDLCDFSWVRALSPLPFVLKLAKVYDRVDIQLGSIHQWIIVQVTAGELGGHEGDIDGLIRTFCRCRPLVLYIIRPPPASASIRTAHRITMGMPFARAVYIYISTNFHPPRTLRLPITIKCYPPIPLQLHDPVQKTTESWVLSVTMIVISPP